MMAARDPETIATLHRAMHSHLPAEPELRVMAIESLLIEKGLVDPEAIDAWVEVFSEEIGPMRGASVVAKAWADADFRTLLLDDAPAAVRRMGYETATTAHLIVVENDARTHNLIVCTLCSCYPMALLGLPPRWYKSAAYRSRAVRDPRGVLGEFGVSLPEDIAVRVWDSTAEIRYFVLPQRPPGTEGWNEERLAALVTRDSMIGTDRDLSPRVGMP